MYFSVAAAGGWDEKKDEFKTFNVSKDVFCSFKVIRNH